MPQDATNPSGGAGATTSSTSDRTSNFSSSSTGNNSSGGSDFSGGSNTSGSSSASFQGSESGSRSHGGVVVNERPSGRPSTATVVGAAILGAVAGGALPFLLSGRSGSTQRRGEDAQVEASVTINRPARQIYDFWRDFTNLPQFMNNIESVELRGDRRSHWKIKAPAGTSVEFDSLVVDDIPGKLIAWRSEEGATVPNRGRVEFDEQSPSRTLVRATISYDPPAGALGQAVAKLFQREPSVQAREDLARLRDLLESGNAR